MSTKQILLPIAPGAFRIVSRPSATVTVEVPSNHLDALFDVPFTILEFPSNGNGRESEPPTIYSDSLTGSLYLDKRNEVAAYESVWTEIVTLSLDEEQSRNLITEMAEEYEAS